MPDLRSLEERKRPNSVCVGVFRLSLPYTLEPLRVGPLSEAKILTLLRCMIHCNEIRYGPIWFASSHANIKNLFALFTSLAIGAIAVTRRIISRPSDRVALGLNISLVLLMSITILPFFLAVGPVVIANKRNTFDGFLSSVDNALLGWYASLDLLMGVVQPILYH